ncbi:MAG TPA: VOC family protein [Vicinamibacterales bacterium]|nr:VOC family protein [Vicinamibacterales bacterium]
MGDSVRGRILWYELLTTDMKAAEAFYTKVVGWTVTPFEGSPQPYDMWTRDGGQPVGGVMNVPAGMHVPPHWAMYVGVPKLEEAVSQIERLGGQPRSPVVEVPTVGRMRVMVDPQGAAFSVYEPAAEPRQPEAPPEPGEVSWHELYTTNAEEAMQFYSAMFGWKPTNAFDMGPMGKYHMFGRQHELGGMMTKPKEMEQVPPNWGLYFRVSDINAGAERVKANGGQILNGPMEVPGGDTIVNCMDPQGAAFSLHAK